MVLDQQDGDAPVADPADEAAELGGLRGIQPGGGLVKQQERRLGGQSARNLEHALHAERQVAGAIVRMRAEAHVAKKAAGVRFDGGFLGSRPPGSQHRGYQSRVRAAVPARHDVFQHRHVGKQLEILESARDAEAHDFVGLKDVDALPGEPDLTPVRALEARDQVDERGLSGAVRADDRLDAAARDAKAHAVHRLEPAEGFAQVANFEEGFGHVSPGAWRAYAAAASTRCRRRCRAAGTSRPG